MIALLWLVTAILASPFKSKYRLEAENTVLRHQVMVLRRQARGRIHLRNLDRLFLVQLYRWFPSILRVLAIIQPETVTIATSPNQLVRRTNQGALKFPTPDQLLRYNFQSLMNERC